MYLSSGLLVQMQESSVDRGLLTCPRSDYDQGAGRFERKIRDVITAEVQEFVRRQRLGFVATVAPDGTPAVSPKGHHDGVG